MDMYSLAEFTFSSVAFAFTLQDFSGPLLFSDRRIIGQHHSPFRSVSRSERDSVNSRPVELRSTPLAGSARVILFIPQKLALAGFFELRSEYCSELEDRSWLSREVNGGEGKERQAPTRSEQVGLQHLSLLARAASLAYLALETSVLLPLKREESIKSSLSCCLPPLSPSCAVSMILSITAMFVAGIELICSCRILYVRNLPFNISSEEMYEIFGKFGAIRQMRL